MAKMPSDMSFRMSRTGDMILSRNGIYVMNVVQRLFHMYPDNDIYNQDGMGLNIRARSHRTYVEGNGVSRDTEYEQMVNEQFTNYTDLIPHNVLAFYRNTLLIVMMDVEYNGERFQLRTSSDPKTLATEIRPKEIPGI